MNSLSFLSSPGIIERLPVRQVALRLHRESGKELLHRHVSVCAPRAGTRGPADKKRHAAHRSDNLALSDLMMKMDGTLCGDFPLTGYVNPHA